MLSKKKEILMPITIFRQSAARRRNHRVVAQWRSPQAPSRLWTGRHPSEFQRQPHRWTWNRKVLESWREDWPIRHSVILSRNRWPGGFRQNATVWLFGAGGPLQSEPREDRCIHMQVQEVALFGPLASLLLWAGSSRHRAAAQPWRRLSPDPGRPRSPTEANSPEDGRRGCWSQVPSRVPLYTLRS